MKSATFYFHMMMKVLADFQICINVPLKKNEYEYLGDWYINSLHEVLKLKQNFRKNKAGKRPLFVIGPFYTPRSICLNIDF